MKSFSYSVWEEEADLYERVYPFVERTTILALKSLDGILLARVCPQRREQLYSYHTLSPFVGLAIRRLDRLNYSIQPECEMFYFSLSSSTGTKLERSRGVETGVTVFDLVQCIARRSTRWTGGSL